MPMPIMFRVLTGEGLGDNAALGGERAAVQRQTESEHIRLLDPATNPETSRDYAQALMLPYPQRLMAIEALKKRAELYERSIPEYWDDMVPRRNVSQSSSWVGDVRYDPASKIAYINLGGNWFSYPNVTPDGMARFLNSDSLGRFLNAKKPYTGQGF